LAGKLLTIKEASILLFGDDAPPIYKRTMRLVRANCKTVTWGELSLFLNLRLKLRLILKMMIKMKRVTLPPTLILTLRILLSNYPSAKRSSSSSSVISSMK